MLNFDKFNECVAALAELYGIKQGYKNYPSKMGLKLLFDCLKSENFTDEEMRQATFKIMKTSKRSETFQLPLPAEFMEAAGRVGTNVKEQAEKESHKVFGSLARYSSRGS